MKSVLAPMSADIIHPGHIDLLLQAAQLGQVTVALNTDDVIRKKKSREPAMTWEERKTVVEQLKPVHAVVPNDYVDYVGVIKEIQPDIVIHGDDWSPEVIEGVRTALQTYGGELILTDYNTYESSSTKIRRKTVIASSSRPAL